MGTPALEDEFRVFGIERTEADPDNVVFGFDTKSIYEKIWRLCGFVRASKTYLAVHPDRNGPTQDGFTLDTGIMMAFVNVSTERMTDVTIGIPHHWMFEVIIGKTGVPVEYLSMSSQRPGLGYPAPIRAFHDISHTI